MANRPERTEGRSRSHHAVWWVVHYEGARDYAQSVEETSEPVTYDVRLPARLFAAPRAAATARVG